MRKWGIGALALVAAAVLLATVGALAIGLLSDLDQRPPPLPEVKVVQSTEPQASPRNMYLSRLERAKDLREVIDILDPELGDSFGEPTEGAELLLNWSARRLTWTQLNALRETSHGLVMKDSRRESGRRICLKGRVAEILARGTGPLRHYDGAVTDGYGARVLRFLAVKSTGEIVAGSTARFCGVAIGRFGYENVSGGQTSSVLAVGMFDLPENRTPSRVPPIGAKTQQLPRVPRVSGQSATPADAAAPVHRAGPCGCKDGDLDCALRCSAR